MYLLNLVYSYSNSPTNMNIGHIICRTLLSFLLHKNLLSIPCVKPVRHIFMSRSFYWENSFLGIHYFLHEVSLDPS